MTGTEQRTSVRRRDRDGDGPRAQRTARVFEVLLISTGCATGVWLVVSVLTSAHT